MTARQAGTAPGMVHIRRQIARKRGSTFYRVQYSADENGSKTLCGDKPTTQDMAWGETRYPKNRAYVTCARCKELREAALAVTR